MKNIVDSIDAAEPPAWEDPLTLINSEPYNPYPVEALPDVIRLAVIEVQSYVQAPMPLIAQSALTASSIAIQAHYNVARDSSLQGPCSLFMLAVGSSGERKTSGDSYFMRAVEAHEREELETIKPQQQIYRADHSAWDAKRSALMGNIKRLTKSEKVTEGVERQLRELEAAAPHPPLYQRILFSDATPEALVHRLATTWPSGAVCSDEAGTVLGSHGMNSDSQMRNLTTLNCLWGGQTLNIDRRSSDSFTLDNPRLSMALQVQKPTLMQFIQKTGQLARGSGFFARFLLSVPESTQGLRPYRDPPKDWKNLDTFNQRIANFLGKEVVLQNGVLTPTVIGLSTEAKIKWVKYHDGVEAELSVSGDLHEIQDSASKIAENAARLAAIFELIENEDATEVSSDKMERAISIATWHLYEAKRFFNEIALPEPVLLANLLDDWLRKYCVSKGESVVSKRHIRQFGPNQLRDGKRLDMAIQELREAKRINDYQVGRKELISLNPKLLQDEI